MAVDRRTRILKGLGRHVGIVVASVVVGFPLGWIAAMWTGPFWDFFESLTGIKSVGHGGPEDWVFELMFVICIAGCFVFLEMLFRSKGRDSRT